MVVERLQGVKAAASALDAMAGELLKTRPPVLTAVSPRDRALPAERDVLSKGS